MMGTCKNCSAPLSSDSPVCRYCGVRNDIDLSCISEYTTVAPAHERTCPHCKISLQSVNIAAGKPFIIERCTQCLGLFFDSSELEAILDETVLFVFKIDITRLNQLSSGQRLERKIAYFPCPVCGVLMNRVNYSVQSGVIVDRCIRHGVWLDAGELRRLLEWRKAGGKLLHEQVRQATQKRGSAPRIAAENEPLLAQMRLSETRFSNENDWLTLFSKVIGKLFHGCF